MVERAMTNPEIVLPLKIDAPANDVESVEAEDPLLERAKKLMNEIQTINKEIYPELSSFVQTSKEKPELMEGEIFQAKMGGFVKKFAEFEVLDGDVYYDLLKDENLKGYFDHDLGNVSERILTNIEILSGMNGRRFTDDHLNLLSAIEKNWPYYSLVMEDILSRKLEQEASFNRKPKEVDMVFVDRALSGFKKELSSKAVSPTKYERESSKDKSEKVQPVGRIDSLKGVLSNDEYVDVPGSLVINSIFNVLRNGCAIYVDAREGGVNLFVEKQGTDLVIRVVDNGIGLSGNQLDPENEKFIFNEGKQKSERGSTGLGLADLDKRMEKAGGMLRVASRKRGDNVEQMVVYPPTVDEKEKQDFKTTLQTGDNSTIFEWRLPIKEKQLAA